MVHMAVWLTLEETASYLRISRSQLYSLARSGGIPAAKLGSKWRFDQEEVDAWMKNEGAYSIKPTEGE